MSVRISCSCGKKLRIREELVGKRVRCPACKQPFEVPPPPEPEDETLEETLPASPPAPEAQERPGEPVKCPGCGLINPPGAPKCDCGFDLENATSLPKMAESSPAGATTDFFDLRVRFSLVVGGAIAALVVVAVMLGELAETDKHRTGSPPGVSDAASGEGKARSADRKDLYESLWKAMAAHEQTYLNAYAEHFRTMPEDPIELLFAFNELVYAVTGYGGLWRKTVPEKYFGCANNEYIPMCQGFKQLQLDFRKWDSLQEEIMAIQTERQARRFLEAHGKELHEYIRKFVPRDQSFSAIAETPIYSDLLAFTRKETEAKREAEEEARKKAEEEAFRHRLGNGYRGAEWGYAFAEVKHALGGEVLREADESAALKFEGGTEAVCFFEEGGLSAVEFDPNLRDADSDGFDAIRDVLVEKYGDYEVVENMAIQTHDMWGNPNPARPARMMRWEDDDTKLSLYVLKYEGRWGYSTTKVKYESKKAIKAAQEREEERKRKAAEEARKKVEGVL